MTLRVAVDWDGTLVDANQEWLPGALEALTAMLTRGHKITIHSSRAAWSGGVDQITERLGNLATRVTIAPKLSADVYIDNQAIPFTGEWSGILDELRLRARRAT